MVYIMGHDLQYVCEGEDVQHGLAQDKERVWDMWLAQDMEDNWV